MSRWEMKPHLESSDTARQGGGLLPGADEDALQEAVHLSHEAMYTHLAHEEDVEGLYLHRMFLAAMEEYMRAVQGALLASAQRGGDCDQH